MRFRDSLGAFATTILVWGIASSSTLAFDGSPIGDLHWRLIGPFRGGRAIAVAGVPGQPEKFYFGAVGGGVWESENAGRTWTPIFDGISVASIGAIAVASSDPNVIYVGTGEADMRSDIQQGSGMYKSTDAGKTWASIGLTDSRQIGRILVDPKDANTVYVAAMGHQYGPNTERGVFKSTDGGKTWITSLWTLVTRTSFSPVCGKPGVRHGTSILPVMARAADYTSRQTGAKLGSTSLDMGFQRS